MGRPIVHVVRFYEPGDDDVDLPRRAQILAGQHMAAPGTDGSQIPAELLPRRVRCRVVLSSSYRALPSVRNVRATEAR
jgi:hypothetical protein